MHKQSMNTLRNLPTRTEMIVNQAMLRQWHDLQTYLHRYKLPLAVFQQEQIYSIAAAMTATGLTLLTPAQQQSLEAMQGDISNNMMNYLQTLGLLDIFPTCRAKGIWTREQLRNCALNYNGQRVRLTVFQRMRIFYTEILYCCGILVLLFVFFLLWS
tara:strand:+ start:1419 stop:1889 length:471 start_codon:yes stop_codon:yes gene_type:complete